MNKLLKEIELDEAIAREVARSKKKEEEKAIFQE